MGMWANWWVLVVALDDERLVGRTDVSEAVPLGSGLGVHGV